MLVIANRRRQRPKQRCISGIENDMKTSGVNERDVGGILGRVGLKWQLYSLYSWDERW